MTLIECVEVEVQSVCEFLLIDLTSPSAPYQIRPKRDEMSNGYPFPTGNWVGLVDDRHIDSRTRIFATTSLVRPILC